MKAPERFPPAGAFLLREACRMKRMMLEYLAVGMFGFLGAVARLFISRLFTHSIFPWGTLIINLTGSLFLGWLYTWAYENDHTTAFWRVAIGIGFVGAYTTFSTYMFESDGMLRRGSFMAAGLYIVGSVAMGLLCVRLGVFIGHRMR